MSSNTTAHMSAHMSVHTPAQVPCDTELHTALGLPGHDQGTFEASSNTNPDEVFSAQKGKHSSTHVSQKEERMLTRTRLTHVGIRRVNTRAKRTQMLPQKSPHMRAHKACVCWHACMHACMHVSCQRTPRGPKLLREPLHLARKSCGRGLIWCHWTSRCHLHLLFIPLLKIRCRRTDWCTEPEGRPLFLLPDDLYSLC